MILVAHILHFNLSWIDKNKQKKQTDLIKGKKCFTSTFAHDLDCFLWFNLCYRVEYIREITQTLKWWLQGRGSLINSETISFTVTSFVCLFFLTFKYHSSLVLYNVCVGKMLFQMRFACKLCFNLMILYNLLLLQSNIYYYIISLIILLAC